MQYLRNLYLSFILSRSLNLPRNAQPPPSPHNLTTQEPANKRSWSIALLDLSAVVAGIKGSRWHPQIAHLLALCCVLYFLQVVEHVGNSVDPAPTKGGGNRENRG
jgi:hypothetical protein